MGNPLIRSSDLYAQYLSIQDEIDAAIAQVIKDSAFVGSKSVIAFEDAFAEYTGAAHCIAVGNGTDALEIIIEALGLAGTEIIIPAFTAVPTAEAVVRAGADPRFCDIDINATLSPNHAEELVYSGTTALLPVHLYGRPADLPSLLSLAEKNGMLLIEDCAQAHGTRLAGQHVGTFGIAGAFSFYPGKNLGAFGDAGAIITQDADLALRCRRIRDHGRLGKFDHDLLGRNSRMDGIQAAVLRVKLAYLDTWTRLRQQNAAYYEHLLKELDEGCYLALLSELPKGADCSYHQYPILVDDRDRMQKYLTEKGVQTGVHYPFVIPDLPPFEQEPSMRGNYVVARTLAKMTLSLPVHEMLSRSDIERVAETLAGNWR